MKDNCGPGMSCAGNCGGNCSGSSRFKQCDKCGATIFADDYCNCAGEPEDATQDDECNCHFCRGTWERPNVDEIETPEPAEFVARDNNTDPYHELLEQYALGWTHGWDDHEASVARDVKPLMPKRALLNGFIAASILWAVLSLFVVACPAQTLAPNVEATTPCLNGKPKTIVDLAVIVAYDSATKTFAFTDSAAEVIGHEMIHQQQARKWAPLCPPYGMHPELLLRDEVEAYCYTRTAFISRRHWTKEETNQEILSILESQFGSLSAHTVAVAWESGCP